MNRKKKSSIILIIIAIIVGPLIYLAYQFTRKLDKKMEQIVEMAEKNMSETKSAMKKNLVGKWRNANKSIEIWDFISDSTLLIDGISYKMKLEMNALLLEGEKQRMVMCIIENDSTLKMSYVKTEMNDIFDKQEVFKLNRIKSN